MLNKELLLCGSNVAPYPPRYPDDTYQNLPSSLLITASRPEGGIDGFEFPWIDRSPNTINDYDGNVIDADVQTWEKGYYASNSYELYKTVITFILPQSNRFTITYSRKFAPSGEEFVANRCLPIYNCDYCNIIRSNHTNLSIDVRIPNMKIASHIHLEGCKKRIVLQ